MSGFPAARSGSGVELQEGERKWSRRGRQRTPLTASLGADRLGWRPALSGVRAAASAFRPLRPLGPGLRRASGRRAAAAQGEAWFLPPRDVSGSRARTGGPPRAQPGGRSEPCPPRGFAVGRLRVGAAPAGSRARSGRLSRVAGFRSRQQEQDVNCFSSAEKEALPPPPDGKCSEKDSAWEWLALQ